MCSEYTCKDGSYSEAVTWQTTQSTWTHLSVQDYSCLMCGGCTRECTGECAVNVRVGLEATVRL